MTNIIALAFSVYAALTPVNAHVDGPGYMRFIRDGRVVYAKHATFISIDGDLGSEGAKVLPEIQLPAGSQTFKVDLQGNVDAGGAHLGRLVLAIFPAGSTSSTTDSFFTFSERPTLTNPGEDQAGVIRTDAVNSSESAPTSAHPKAVTESKHSALGEHINLNLTIDGVGYFKVTGSDGSPQYTRDGHLTTDSTGEVVTLQGLSLVPNIVLPLDSRNLKVDRRGSVTVTEPGASSPVTVGNLMLVTFPNPAGLTRVSSNLYAEGSASGPGSESQPGTKGAGTIRFGATNESAKSAILTKGTNPVTTSSSSKSSLAPGVQIEILVRQHSDVVGDAFTLGDIATINGPEDLVEAFQSLKIGATAIVGVNRVIDPRYVAIKLRGAGHPEGSYVLVVPDGAEVARKTKTVAIQEITDVAIKAAQDKIGAKIDFRITSTVHPIVAADGDVVLEASDPDATAKGYTVVVTAREGNTIVGTQTVTLVPPAQLGEIKIGDTVKVILKSGAACIEVEGRAVSAGFVGQKIKVSVTASPNSGGGKTTTQTGTVIEAGKVEVDL